MEAPAVPAGRLRGLDHGLVPDELAGELQGGRVGLAGQQQLGPVAVEHGGGAVAVAVLELGLVVPDGQQLDALASSGGGQLGELLDGGAVAGLVQAHEQPGVEHAAGLGGGQLLGLPDDDGDQQLEQGPESFLLGRWRVEVEGVVGSREEFVEVEVAAVGRGGHRGIAVDVEEGFGGAVDRAPVSSSSMIMAVSRRASKPLPAQAARSRRSPSSGITGTGWSGMIGGRILAIGLAGSSSSSSSHW
jgi:hypothetical protein